MLQEPRRLRQTLGDALWVRIVDVETALRERTYAAADRVVIAVDDRLCPRNTGSWALDTGGSTISITRTEEPADIALTASDLATIYMGGFSVADLRRAGRAESGRAGAA
ncbi:MAG: sterol carrier protein domain-containing protein, partial [Actinomycetota bacterium]|nr:sterol carrier protein domain-containing protein [Actinomycetota bacterium]